MNKRNGIIAGCVLVALAAAFMGGRYTAQGADVKEVEKVVYKDRVVEKIVTVTVKEAAEIKRVVVYRDRVTTPDGTITEREVEKTDTDTKVSEHAETDKSREEKSSGKTETDRTVVASKPQWRVGALVGAQLSLTPSLAASVVYGAQVERRILGPFFIGAWGLNNGSVGISISGEF